MILDVLVHVGSCAVYVAFDTVVLVVNIVVVGGDNKVRRDFVHRCVLGGGAPKSECSSLVIKLSCGEVSSLFFAPVIPLPPYYSFI